MKKPVKAQRRHGDGHNEEVRGPGVDQQIVEMFLSRGCQLLADFGESKWNRKLVLLKTQ